MIHCLKEGGVAADTRESIRRDTAMLATAMDTELEESDPFLSSCYCKFVLLTSEFTPHGLPSECLASWTNSSCQSVVSDFMNTEPSATNESTGFTVEGQARSIVSRKVVGWWRLDLARAMPGCKFITSPSDLKLLLVGLF